MVRNETVRTLLARRSIRKYRPEQISGEELDEILNAGIWAPSGMNLQSVVLVAVTNKADRDELMRLNMKISERDHDPYYGAPTIVVVLADTDISRFGVEDGSLAIGNMMNAAASLGIGSCWIHRAREIFAGDEGKALLKKWGLNGSYIGVGHCILGYPDETPEPKDRRPGRTFVICDAHEI